jgi:hypothetical protein
VSAFTTMVSGEGSARRQSEVASSAYSSSPRRNGHNLHRGEKSRFGSTMAVRIVRRQAFENARALRPVINLQAARALASRCRRRCSALADEVIE